MPFVNKSACAPTHPHPPTNTHTQMKINKVVRQDTKRTSHAPTQTCTHPHHRTCVPTCVSLAGISSEGSTTRTFPSGAGTRTCWMDQPPDTTDTSVQSPVTAPPPPAPPPPHTHHLPPSTPPPLRLQRSTTCVLYLSNQSDRTRLSGHRHPKRPLQQQHMRSC